MSGSTKHVVAAGAVLAVGVALQGTTKVAHAIPTTLSYYPSTDFVAKQNFHFNASVYTNTSLANETYGSEGITYGVGPEKDGVFGRTEIGLDYVSSGSGLTYGGGGSIPLKDRVWINAKTQLFNNDKQGVRVVAGIWGLGSKGDNTTAGSTAPPDAIYLLASKAFPFGRVHVGVEHFLQKKFGGAFPVNPLAAFDAAGNQPSFNKTGIQLGFDRSFDNGKFVFATDYLSGKSNYSLVEPSILWNVTDSADFQLGYLRFNDKNVAPSPNQLYIGFDYTFNFLPKK